MRRALALVSFSALTACGGSGSHALPATSSAMPPVTPGAPATSARFTIIVPPKSATAANARTPKYISSSTQSIVITLETVNGTAFTGSPASTATNLTTSNPACSSSSGTLTCTASAPAIPGADSYSVVTYDAQQSSSSPASPAGNILSEATLPITIVANQVNMPATPLVLNGVPASIAVTSTDPHVLGTQAAGYSLVGNRPYTITLAALDADNNTIIGPGAPTFTVTSGSSAITVSPASANTATVQVKSFSATPVMLTVTPSLGSAINVAFATVQEIWVSDLGTDSVTGYAAGTNVAISADTLGTSVNVTDPQGIAFDKSGNLWVSNGSNITEYAAGNLAQITANTINATGTANSPISDAVGLAFDTSGNLWVANLSSNSVTEFAAGTNTQITANTISTNGQFPLAEPSDVAFDAAGNILVTSDFDSAVSEYVPGTSTPITGDTITAGIDGPFSLAFDKSANLWVVNTAASTVTEYAAGTHTQVTSNTITAGLNVPRAVAFDANGNLWVTNQDVATVTEYAAGTNTQITANTITAGLSSPFGLAITP